MYVVFIEQRLIDHMVVRLSQALGVDFAMFYPNGDVRYVCGWMGAWMNARMNA